MNSRAGINTRLRRLTITGVSYFSWSRGIASFREGGRNHFNFHIRWRNGLCIYVCLFNRRFAWFKFPRDKEIPQWQQDYIGDPNQPTTEHPNPEMYFGDAAKVLLGEKLILRPQTFDHTELDSWGDIERRREEGAA